MMNWWFIGSCIVLALLTAVSVKYPLINDITTDFNAPPPIPRSGDYNTGEGDWIPYPSEFAAVQARAYPDVRPMKVRLSAEATLELIERLVSSMPALKIIAHHPSRPIILMRATTPWMRFKDDLALRIEEKASHTLVHFRSRSRIGLGDLGTNAKRIRSFQARLTELVEEIKPLSESPKVSKRQSGEAL